MAMLTSCGTSHKTIGVKNTNSKTKESQTAHEVVDFAKGYLGTKYQYGGASKSGMDCSGLIYMSFLNAADMHLPRTTKEMAKEGKKVKNNRIQKGDLVFFNTLKGGGKYNHSGIVVKAEKEDVQFIHSSTSKGVMVSGLNEDYWRKAFVEARRIL